MIYELTDFSIYPTVIFVLFLLALLNLFLRRFLRKFALSATELSTVYVMLSIATSLFGHDMMRQLSEITSMQRCPEGVPVRELPLDCSEAVATPRERVHFADVLERAGHQVAGWRTVDERQGERIASLARAGPNGTPLEGPAGRLWRVTRLPEQVHPRIPRGRVQP